MKRTLGITLAVAFAISAVAAPAMGASDNAKGKGGGLAVQQETCSTFGHLGCRRKGAAPELHMKNVGVPALFEAIDAGHAVPGNCPE